MSAKSPFKDFPIGHMHATALAGRFTADCALIGGLVIAWGQFDRELCSLFGRLLGFSYLKPTDARQPPAKNSGSCLTAVPMQQLASARLSCRRRRPMGRACTLVRIGSFAMGEGVKRVGP
jgi:hypothetical protein